MDGPVRLGERQLAVEFQSDRHGADRIESAYERLDMLATADLSRKGAVQTRRPSPAEISDFATENQG